MSTQPMSKRRCPLWVITGAMVAGLVGCHGQAKTSQDELQAAQSALMGELMTLQQCELQNGLSSGQCADERAAYERDLAAFQAKYTK